VKKWKHGLAPNFHETETHFRKIES